MLEATQARLLEIPGIGSAALERLRASRVAIVGVGTLGGPLALHLALLGAPLLLVDPGAVEPANLAAQLFSVRALGLRKVEARAAQIRALGGEGALQLRAVRLEALGAAELAGFDLAVSALDALRPRLQLDALCQRLGIPMLDLAVDGSGQRLHGKIASFDPRAPDAACYACRFDARALEAIRREDLPAGCPSWRLAPESAAPPTLQVSSFAGVVAGLGALRAVRILLDPPGTHAGSLLRIDGDSPERIHHTRVARSPHCSHIVPYGPLRPARGDSPEALIDQARVELGQAPDWLALQRALLLGARCRACGARRELFRCAQAVADADLRCTACASDAALEPIEVTHLVHTAGLGAAARATWRQLGFPDRDVVGVRSGTALAQYLITAEEPA